MPYIDSDSRNRLEYEGNYQHPKTAGELNYIITKACWKYIKEAGGRYQQYNDVMGALEGAKLELYRRKISIYEDQKGTEHGDVYDA